MDMVRKDSAFDIDTSGSQTSNNLTKENEKPGCEYVCEEELMGSEEVWEDYEDDEGDEDYEDEYSSLHSNEHWKEWLRSRATVEAPETNSIFLSSRAASNMREEDHGLGAGMEEGGSDQERYEEDDWDKGGDGWQECKDWKEGRDVNGEIVNDESLQELPRHINQHYINFGLRGQTDVSEEAIRQVEGSAKGKEQGHGDSRAIGPPFRPGGSLKMPVSPLRSKPPLFNHSTSQESPKWWFTGPQPLPQLTFPTNARNTFRWTLPGLSSAQSFQIPGPYYRARPPATGSRNSYRFTLSGLSSAQPFQIPGPFYRELPPGRTAAQRSAIPGLLGIRALQPSTPSEYTFSTAALPPNSPRSMQLSTTAPAARPALKRKAGSSELRLMYCCHGA